jgi:hypothetical protein
MATLTASSSSPGLLKRCGSSFGSGELLGIKRNKLEVDSGTFQNVSDSSVENSDRVHVQSHFSSDIVKTSTGDRRIVGATLQESGTCATPAAEKILCTEKLVDVNLKQSGGVSQVSDSNSSLSVVQQPSKEDPEPIVPLKSTRFLHLHQKYSSELEYMLLEFQKLERQLLGAKTAVGAASAESVASRERREKLHSFIQHLEDTIQQIITGVELEAAGQSTYHVTKPDRDSALSDSVSKEKEEEEAVQKLEEHILANLLPVKVRLKKQLAAQQGAKHNPAGMPTVRGVVLQADTSQQGKATFLTKVEERRASLFGSTLHGVGSNLTQKLHGTALGSSQPVSSETIHEAKDENASSARTDQTETTSKILYGGLALGSSQIMSSVQAASAVHKVEIQNPDLMEARSKLHLALVEDSVGNTPVSTNFSDLKLSTLAEPDLFFPESGDDETALSDDYDDDEPDHIYSKHGTQLSLAAHAAIMSYEEKRKARKKRRKKKKLLLLKKQEKEQRQQVPIAVATATSVQKRKKIVKKRGPQSVEYMCALCNEVYNSTCDYNPWWTLIQHECLKCNKMQVSCDGEAGCVCDCCLRPFPSQIFGLATFL